MYRSNYAFSETYFDGKMEAAAYLQPLRECERAKKSSHLLI